MDIQYRQLSPREALKMYADWLVEQQAGGVEAFLESYGEWYMIFYPLRTLMLAGKLFREQRYIDVALKYVDIYVGEQLPNGGFTSNYRRTTTDQLSKRAFQELLRSGKINLADVGSNATGIIQAATLVNDNRKEKYLDAVRKWLDNWVPIWALKEGGYGNGIWGGHKLNSPYTCAISTVATAQSAFSLVTGETEYVENAERCLEFQCAQWLDDGRPLFLNCYPRENTMILEDYGHTFYLLEGMCWTHWVSGNQRLKKLLAAQMKKWLFGERGILSQWQASWFNFNNPGQPPMPGETMSSKCGIRPGWELAKSNGIIHAFLYYLNNIEELPELRKTADLGLQYLSHPLKARMSGVASEPDESYGMFAVQATGFAGLSLAEGIAANTVFRLQE